MILHFRNKNSRDIETYSETVVSANSFINIVSLKQHGPSPASASQQQETAGVENTLEHRK